MKNCSSMAALGLLFGLLTAPALAQEKVRGAHESQPPSATQDDLGITVPIPTSFPARRYPADHDFPTGPAIGERIPDFELPNQDGKLVDFHSHRGGEKAIIVFYRSVVW
ncbi:MAG: hypothetical protein VYE73_15065 [Acidobacteriota bacterium]|nr:hypothetical protein [Acidobacteriota bacterium]